MFVGLLHPAAREDSQTHGVGDRGLVLSVPMLILAKPLIPLHLSASVPTMPPSYKPFESNKLKLFMIVGDPHETLDVQNFVPREVGVLKRGQTLTSLGIL